MDGLICIKNYHSYKNDKLLLPLSSTFSFMKTIRLVIYNEAYWNKGLIYSQNILPLYNLSKNRGCNFEIISFTSLLMYFRKRKQILKAHKELSSEGIKVIDKFVFVYPHRIFFPHFLVIPYLYINVCFYIIFLSKKDKNESITYFLRSYQTALFFYKFYRFKSNLIFDTRTDWLEENVNLGRIKRGSKTYNYWMHNLKRIIIEFRKTLCISAVCKSNICKSLDVPSDNVDVVYNPIKYDHFNVNKISHEGVNFLYTGSIGNWNKLENYIKIFQIYLRIKGNAKFIVCTSSAPAIVNSVLARSEYSNIRNYIDVHYSVSYNELPQYYALCDYGFQLMEKPDSRVGVKFVEYIAAGITPIINSNVQGAVYLAEKYNMGVIILENDSDEVIISKIEKGRNQIDRKSNNFNSFRELTDIDNIAQKYSFYL